MRQRRVKIDSKDSEAVYHCTNRIVGGEHLMNDRCNETFRVMLWKVAEFCGVEPLTYNLLNNHNHIYTLVPKRTPISDEELLRRWEILHPVTTKYEKRTLENLRIQLATNTPVGQQFRRRMYALMNDVSQYMKILKQRFTKWYNENHPDARGKPRIGTIWAARFGSSLDEIVPVVNSVVGSYIDLNSVRAGLIADPKDYRFSGYAEAIAGNPKARKGIMFLTGIQNWEIAQAHYRKVIFATGSVTKEKGGRLSRAQLLEVISQGGHLPLETLLQCRIRFLTQGLILGTPAFVQKHLGLCRDGLAKPRRVHVLPWTVEGQSLAIPKRMRGPVFC